MFTGKVVGSVVSIIKDSSLSGIKLLLVQIFENGEPGKIIIAADVVRVSGLDDTVYVVSGREAAIGIGSGLIPIDAGIVGIINPKIIGTNKK